MQVTVYKTDRITPRSHELLTVLDNVLPRLEEGSVIAITSKIVSLCEGRVVPVRAARKDDLIAQEADLFLPRTSNKYDVCFTVTRNTLIAGAGIDESNANDHYILWPADPQKTANDVRQYLRKKYGLKNLGVIITDSTTRPFQWGTTGIAIAYSGFKPLEDYIGKDDLFGRKFIFHKSNIANGLAAAAVLPMGEGAEQTPVAVVSEVPFVNFVEEDPSEEELQKYLIGIEDDIFAPFLTAVAWQKGKGGKADT